MKCSWSLQMLFLARWAIVVIMKYLVSKFQKLNETTKIFTYNLPCCIHFLVPPDTKFHNKITFQLMWLKHIHSTFRIKYLNIHSKLSHHFVLFIGQFIWILDCKGIYLIMHVSCQDRLLHNLMQFIQCGDLTISWGSGHSITTLFVACLNNISQFWRKNCFIHLVSRHVTYLCHSYFG